MARRSGINQEGTHTLGNSMSGEFTQAMERPHQEVPVACLPPAPPTRISMPGVARRLIQAEPIRAIAPSNCSAQSQAKDFNLIEAGRLPTVGEALGELLNLRGDFHERSLGAHDEELPAVHLQRPHQVVHELSHVSIGLGGLRQTGQQCEPALQDAQACSPLLLDLRHEQDQQAGQGVRPPLCREQEVRTTSGCPAPSPRPLRIPTDRAARRRSGRGHRYPQGPTLSSS